MLPARVRVITTENAFERKNPGLCRMLVRACGHLIRSVWRGCGRTRQTFEPLGPTT
jgi:hypothetical protein